VVKNPGFRLETGTVMAQSAAGSARNGLAQFLYSAAVDIRSGQEGNRKHAVAASAHEHSIKSSMQGFVPSLSGRVSGKHTPERHRACDRRLVDDCQLAIKAPQAFTSSVVKTRPSRNHAHPPHSVADNFSRNFATCFPPIPYTSLSSQSRKNHQTPGKPSR
jgi:hypothetical protein